MESILMEEEGTSQKMLPLQEKGQTKPPSKLVFGVDKIPPLHIAILYGLQVALTIISGPIAVSVVVHKTICAEGDNTFLAELIGSSMFSVGVATVLQVICGVRLPILQGSSMFYVYALTALLDNDDWRCPAQEFLDTSSDVLATDIHNTSVRITNSTSYSTSHLFENIDRSHLWKPRVALISGGIIIASIFHMLLGALGLVGILTKFVGPITVTTCIGLIAIGLCPIVVNTSKECWPVALFTVIIALVCGIILGETKCPCPKYDRKKGCNVKSRYPIFKIFANNFALIGGWALCIALTAAGVFPSSPNEVGFYARTDAKLNAVFNSNWINLPYPGQWGIPTVSYVAVLAFLPIVLGSVIESIGDYIATGNACEVGRPPIHAMNRGILMEGVASFFSGFVGTCHATTSYSNMVGLIAYTGVCSRFVWLVAGLICISGGIFGKVGAMLATVPEPVIGGLVMMSYSMVLSVGLSSLSRVDMKSSRNLIVVGLSFILGISIPMHTKKYPDGWRTGNGEFDRIARIILSTEPVVGSVIACLLDNVLPGSASSRGMSRSDDDQTKLTADREREIFGLPCMKNRFDNFKIFWYIPFLPCYRDARICTCCSKSNGSHDQEVTSTYVQCDAKGIDGANHIA